MHLQQFAPRREAAREDDIPARIAHLPGGREAVVQVIAPRRFLLALIGIVGGLAAGGGSFQRLRANGILPLYPGPQVLFFIIEIVKEHFNNRAISDQILNRIHLLSIPFCLRHTHDLPAISGIGNNDSSSG